MIKRLLSSTFSGLLLCTCVSGLLLSSCGSRFASIFYEQKNPQALQRDTVLPSGDIRSWIDYSSFKANGIIKLATVEHLPAMDSVSISVPATAKTSLGVFDIDRKLYLPSGYRAQVYAWNLGKASDIVVRDDGTLFVSDLGGRILAITGEGTVTPIATGLSSPHGMEIVDGALYYVDERHVYRFDFSSPTSIEGKQTQLTDQLPDAGEFYARTIRYRPADGKFYISVGASDANGEERDREHATIFRMDKEGGRPTRMFISGLRNTMGMDVHPVTGDLWGVDQGMDNLAEQLAPDEVNILKSGGQFGHPYYYSKNYRNPKFADYKDGDIRLPKDPTAPAIELQPYSIPTDLQFYTKDALGAEWKNSMLIVFKGYVLGAVNRPKELRTGFKVIRLRSKQDGSDAIQADFISGWLDKAGDFWGQPVGIAWSKDGKTFFVTDEKNGIVYKFSAP